MGPKKWIGCVRFVSFANRSIVSVPARISALNATEHGFLHRNETDRNEPNVTIGSKKVDWVRSFRFSAESEHHSVPARISALNATEQGFLHSKETDRNEPKHHCWVQKKWIGCVRFVSFPNRSIVSVPARISALNATEHGFLHSNETDRNEPKHHYWVQKSGLGAFVSFSA